MKDIIILYFVDIRDWDLFVVIDTWFVIGDVREEGKRM
jgi:hypothetical protein